MGSDPFSVAGNFCDPFFAASQYSHCVQAMNGQFLVFLCHSNFTRKTLCGRVKKLI